MFIIQPIVEGHGEVQAVPELLRRIAHSANFFDIQISEPIRRKSSELTSEVTLKKSVELALQFNPDAIFVIFDSDDLCPKVDAARFGKWASTSARRKKCEVTLAHREYEAWFLASVESLRGKCNVKADASYLTDPEAKRGAKEALENLMDPPNYSETHHQVKMSSQFEMSSAYARCRSFRHLVTAFGRAINAPNNFKQWPPTPK